MNHIALNNPTPPTPPKLCIARILCLLLQIAAFLIECARRLQAGRSADEDACPRLLATTACSRSVVKRRSAQCNNCRKTAQNDVIACLAGACVARVCFSQASSSFSTPAHPHARPVGHRALPYRAFLSSTIHLPPSNRHLPLPLTGAAARAALVYRDHSDLLSHS